MPEQLLLVDDEPDLVEVLRRAFEAHGYQVRTAPDGETALAQAAQAPPDLILLDLLMPGMGGFEVCRALREHPRLRDIPVIMLTALHETPVKVGGLDLGADDYVTKPYDFRELLARVRIQLRAARGAALTFGDVRLDRTRQELQRNGERVALTRREFALLELFFQQPGTVLRRGMLLDTAWGADSDADSNVLDVYMRRLRRKLAQVSDAVRLRTVRGDGYILELPTG